MNQRRKYKKLLNKKILEKYQDRLTAELRKEWDRVEHGAKNEKIIEVAKETGMKMGRVLLGLLLIGGALTIAVVAPNMFGAIGRVKARRRFFERKAFLKTKDYLVKKGYIELRSTKKENVYELCLTEKGRQRMLAEQVERKKICGDSTQWDQRWRLVLFDIPEKNKSVREAFRKRLLEMGLYPLQDSVFVSPFPVKEEIAMINEMFGTASGVRCVEAIDIGEDDEVKTYFKLST